MREVRERRRKARKKGDLIEGVKRAECRKIKEEDDRLREQVLMKELREVREREKTRRRKRKMIRLRG